MGFVMGEKEEKKVNVEVKETKKDSNKDTKSNKKETPKKEVSKRQTVKKEQPEKEETKQKANKLESKEENASTDKIDYTFRKVENINLKEEKKGSFIGKLFKAILIVIIILIVFYCIFVARNFLILSDIQEKVRQYDNLTNYSYETKGTAPGQDSVYNFSKSGNIDRMDVTFYLDSGEERSLVVWRDVETNEAIVAYPIEKEAITTTPDQASLGLAKLPFQLALQGDYLKLYSLTALIYSEEYNGKDCYVIQMGLDSKEWVEKNTGIVWKVQNGNLVTEVVNVEINTVDEIYKPDLTGYEITEQE